MSPVVKCLYCGPKMAPPLINTSGGRINRQLESIASDLVFAQAVRDKLAAGDGVLRGTNLVESGEPDDGAACSSAEQRAQLEDAEDLSDWRERRIAQLKLRRKQEDMYRKQGGGTYEEVDEKVFFDIVTTAERTICHFYHKEFDRCKIVDLHLNKIAEAHVESRFLKVNCEKAQFLVAKLEIRVLPTIVVFLKGIASKSIVGFAEFGSKDTFKTETLERLLYRYSALQTIRLGSGESSDEGDDE